MVKPHHKDPFVPDATRLTTRTLRQIEKFRKGDVVLEVRDKLGQPVPNMSVSVEQEKHAFLFGVSLPDLEGLSQRDRQRCLERAHEVFNHFLLSGKELSLADEYTLVDTTTDSNCAKGIPLGQLRCRLDTLGRVGHKLLVLVSGSTVGLSSSTTSTMPEREIGQRVANLYTLCFSHPHVCGIIWKYFYDREGEECGLLRQDLAPKYTFQLLRKLVTTVWHSRAAGKTNETGQFHFRGFHGDYRVIVTLDRGIGKVFQRTLRQCVENERWIVELSD